MADKSEIDDLARRYLDLWQEQTKAVLTDPALGENLARYFQVFAAMAGSGLGDRPAAARPAAGSGADDLDRLHRRLGDLEARVAALEAERDARPARRRRSGGSGGPAPRG